MELILLCDMNNQRIIEWPSFDGKKTRNGIFIKRPCPKTIDGFCWKGDQAALLEKFCCLFN